MFRLVPFIFSPCSIHWKSKVCISISVYFFMHFLPRSIQICTVTPKHSLCPWAFSEAVVGCTVRLFSAKSIPFSRNGSQILNRQECVTHILVALKSSYLPHPPCWAAAEVCGVHAMALCHSHLLVPLTSCLPACCLELSVELHQKHSPALLLSHCYSIPYFNHRAEAQSAFTKLPGFR